MNTQFSVVRSEFHLVTLTSQDDEENIEIKLWLGLVDYKRVAWFKTQEACNKNLRKREHLLQHFQDTWYHSEILSSWEFESKFIGKIKLL